MKVKKPTLPLQRKGRAAVRDAIAPDAADELEAPPIESASGMVATSLSGRAASVLVTAALIAGPLGLAVAMLRDGATAAVAAPPAPVVVDSPNKGRVGEFAMSVVVATVTASVDRKSPGWVPGDAGVAETGMRVENPAVVEATRESGQDQGEAWSVTVAATITGTRGSAVRRFFLVPVLLDGAGQMRALGGISVIAGPTYGDPGRLAYAEHVTARPIRDAVDGFLAALLTGEGDVARYVSPGSPITAVTPAPFRQVNLVDLTSSTDMDQVVAAGATARVLAVATGVVSSAEKLPLSYALTVTLRDGRWEVSRLDAIPLTSDLKSSGAPSPGPSSSSATAPTK